MRTAKTHRKFAIYSTFLDTILEGEEEIQEGETRKDVLKRINKELEETAAELRKEAESMKGVQEADTYPKTYDGRDRFQHMTSGQLTPTEVTFGPPPIIDLSHERLEIEIDNCKTEEELKQWKEKNQVIPVPILKHYNNRLKQLNNE